MAKPKNIIQPTPEQLKLIAIFQRAENDIIKTIGYKLRNDFVDYAEQAVLRRVQIILQKMIGDAWQYTPDMIYSVFKDGVYNTVNFKDFSGYKNAFTLTSTQTAVVERLVENLMGNIVQMAIDTKKNIYQAYREAERIAGAALRPNPIIGRLNPDVYRTAGLEAVAHGKATGGGVVSMDKEFINIMQQRGIVGFTDKGGKNWTLANYANMATRTTSAQAVHAGVLYADPEHDLYRITSHFSACPLCAKYEGRVYSRSGKDPRFPPLATAFGKIDPNGPDDISNTYLNIHPNCLHRIVRFSEGAHSKRDLEKIERESNEPFNVDRQSAASREAYRKKVAGRAELMREYREWQKMMMAGTGPRTFATYQKHKIQGSATYQGWRDDLKAAKPMSDI